MTSSAFDRLRPLKLIETSAEDFLTVLNGGKVSVAHYLRRLHNLALRLGWLLRSESALLPHPRAYSDDSDSAATEFLAPTGQGTGGESGPRFNFYGR